MHKLSHNQHTQPQFEFIDEMKPFGRRFQSLLLILFLATFKKGVAAAYEEPLNCRRLECAPYEVIHSQEDFEIRSYRNATWMSSPPINSSSYKEAAGTGFNILFAYIQGKNQQGAQVEMTAPVLVDIFPSTGPFCNSSFVVHFYMPRRYQQDPPTSDQVHPVRLPEHRYAAVRTFGGFMDDSNIPVQALALKKSLESSPWGSVIAARDGGDPSPYSVAGYNSPYEYENRVNEIMFWFDQN